MSPFSLARAAFEAAAALPPSTALPNDPTILENLEFQAVGLVIVLGALFGLYALCALTGQVFTRLERRQAEEAPPPAGEEAALAAEGAAAAPAAETVPLAVIAAAVAAVVDQPHRVVEVKPAGLAGWSLEGRRQIFASHQLPRR